MFDWLGRQARHWRERRQRKRELDPEAFRALARELANLARMAESVWPREHEFYNRIKGIQEEMVQLDRMASQPGFRRLSQEQRLALRDNLLKSRSQLIQTVTTAPSPTTTLQ